MKQWQNWRFKHSWFCRFAIMMLASFMVTSSGATTLRDAVEDSFLFTSAETGRSWIKASEHEKNELCLSVLEAYLTLHQNTRTLEIYSKSESELKAFAATLADTEDIHSPEAVELVEKAVEKTLKTLNEITISAKNQLIAAHAKYVELTGARASNLQSSLSPSLFSGSTLTRDNRRDEKRFQRAVDQHKQLQFRAARRARAYHLARTASLVDPALFAQFLTALDDLRQADLKLAASEADLVRLHFQARIRQTDILLHLGLSPRLIEKKKHTQRKLLARQHAR
ncbi:hypothetical protein SAMN04488518_105239 [Pseudovibrio ascidiaceicola]|uniref:Uncharacterized protein n=1 Tax=Pseudovibrio ascidiaceicola TaxID=285279 RepID=A0A1I3ZRP2_9HYPH|nr:hypothetical protein [Pseudovibrio ascidiaceicola]SFK46765.1 hypothetical protein SAMN04488518_105239 [Pseudovibrio ascidiaceicola]